MWPDLQSHRAFLVLAVVDSSHGRAASAERTISGANDIISKRWERFKKGSLVFDLDRVYQASNCHTARPWYGPYVVLCGVLNQIFWTTRDAWIGYRATAHDISGWRTTAPPGFPLFKTFIGGEKRLFARHMSHFCSPFRGCWYPQTKWPLMPLARKRWVHLIACFDL